MGIAILSCELLWVHALLRELGLSLPHPSIDNIGAMTVYLSTNSV